MPLTQEDTEQIVRFAKKEPCTINDIAQLLGRSWVTADSYVNQVAERTGLVSIKVFRKGSHGALKLVYYNYSESLSGEGIREELYEQIRSARGKEGFNFFEVFQFAPKKRSKAYSVKAGNVSQDRLGQLFARAEGAVYCFSGNLSFLDKKGILLLEKLLKRKVRVKILCRVDAATLNALSSLARLLKNFPDYLEIRHCYQPLRGFIIDDAFCRFKNDELPHREGELEKNMRIYYELSDEEWIGWLQQVFWALWRTSLDQKERVERFKQLRPA